MAFVFVVLVAPSVSLATPRCCTVSTVAEEGSAGIAGAQPEGEKRFWEAYGELFRKDDEVNGWGDAGDLLWKLIGAIEKEDPEQLGALLEKHPALLGIPIVVEGADGQTPLELAAKRGHRESAGLLLDRGAEHTIFSAAAMGDLAVMKDLLAEEPGLVRARHLPGETPLHWAAEVGQIGAMKLLLENGADVNTTNSIPIVRTADGETPLHWAARAGMVEAVHLLLSHGAEVDGVDETAATPLAEAATWGQAEAARVLLEAGADANAHHGSRRSPLRHAVRAEHMNIAEMLVAAGAGHDVFTAARLGDCDALAELLEDEPSLATATTDSSYRYTALHWAARGGHRAAATLLVEHGADVNAIACARQTPLYEAARAGSAEVAELLIENGARVSGAPRSHFTPLDVALGKGHYGVAQLLGEHGGQTRHLYAP